jgi:hypothetical protein
MLRVNGPSSELLLKIFEMDLVDQHLDPLLDVFIFGMLPKTFQVCDHFVSDAEDAVTDHIEDILIGVINQ